MSLPIARIGPAEPEQLSIEGFPVIKGRTRFDLTNTKKLVTERVLVYNDAVSGTFRGRVKGLRYMEAGGELVAVFVIEVLESDLD